MEEADVEKREAPHAGRQMESAGKVLTKDFILVILRGKESQGSLSLVCCTYLIVFCRSLTPNASSWRFVTILSEQTHYLSLTLGHILVILTVFHTFSSLFYLL